MKLKQIDSKSKLESFSRKGNWNKKLIKTISTDLFWILLISGILRLYYYSLFVNTQDPDSASYLNYLNIFKGQTDGFRTPVYPYFIKFIRLFGQQNLINNIIVAQSIISFLSIVVFYKIVCNVFKTRKTTIAASLMYGTMLPIINFDKVIRTESLSICFTVLFLMLIVGYLQKQTILKALLVTLFVFLMIMLRPSFIFLLPLIIAFWILRLIYFKKDRKMCLAGLVSSFIVILLLAGYSNLIKKNTGFYGISTVTNINQLDIIIIADMYMNGDDPELSEVIKNNLDTAKNDKGHWVLLSKINTKYEPERISKFIHYCIKNQPVAYFKRTYQKVLELRSYNIFSNYAMNKQSHSSLVMKDVVEPTFFFVTFNLFYLFLSFDLIFILIRLVKLKRVPWFSIILWSIIVAQLSVTIIGAQDEYQRLIVTIIPCLIIIAFYYVDQLCYSIDKHKLKNYQTI